MIKTFCDLCGDTIENFEIGNEFFVSTHLPQKSSEALRPVDFKILAQTVGSMHLHRKCQLQLLVEQANRDIKEINEKHEDKINEPRTP